MPSDNPTAPPDPAPAPRPRTLKIDSYWIFAGLLFTAEIVVLPLFFPRLQPPVFALFIMLWMLRLKRLERPRTRLIAPALIVFALAATQSIGQESNIRLGATGLQLATLCWLVSLPIFAYVTWRIGRLKPALDTTVFSEEPQEP